MDNLGADTLVVTSIQVSADNRALLKTFNPSATATDPGPTVQVVCAQVQP